MVAACGGNRRARFPLTDAGPTRPPSGACFPTNGNGNEGWSGPEGVSGEAAASPD